jgi:hypothetical protein
MVRPFGINLEKAGHLLYMMRDEADMRTTLAIDDDVLIAAKAMATQQHRSVARSFLSWRDVLCADRPAAASAMAFLSCQLGRMRRQ